MGGGGVTFCMFIGLGLSLILAVLLLLELLLAVVLLLLGLLLVVVFKIVLLFDLLALRFTFLILHKIYKIHAFLSLMYIMIIRKNKKTHK